MTDDVDTGRHALVARIALGIVALVGAFLVAIPLVTNLPGKSSATGDMMTAFRPQMSDAALAQGQADQQTMTAMLQQMNTQMLPALAQQMHMTPAQLSTYLATTYPAVGKGMAQTPQILPFFQDLQGTMQAQQSNYQQADAIPTGFLPPTSMTWLFVIPGAILLILGGYGALRPVHTRRLLAAGTAVGVLMVAGLLAASMYGKASAADDMTAAFKPIFAADSVAQAQAYSATVDAMSVQLTQQALPGLATALHVTPLQLAGTIQKSFPAVATGVTQMPQIVQRMRTATGLIAANVDNYNQSAAIPWTPGSMVTMFWLMMAPALVALVVGAGALFLGRTRRIVLPAHTRFGGILHPHH